jgi:hypothetical protein
VGDATLTATATAVDLEVDTVHAAVLEQEDRRVHDLVRGDEAADRRACPHGVEHRVGLVGPGRCVSDDPGMDGVHAHRGELHCERSHEALDAAVHRRDRRGAGIRAPQRLAAEQQDRGVVGQAVGEDVHDLRVPDELEVTSRIARAMS